MITPAHHNIDPSTIAGAIVTVFSGLFSFFGSTLPVVQWFAAIVAIVVGITTFVKIVKDWRK